MTALRIFFGFWLGIALHVGAMDPSTRGMIPYRPVLSGVTDFSMRDAIMKENPLFSLQKMHLPTVAAIKQRAATGMKATLKYLNDQGYYNAQVDYSINFETKPITVNFMVNLGPLYTLKNFSISGTDPNNLLMQRLAMNAGMVGVAPTTPASKKHIRDAIKKLFVILGNQGYPYAKIKHEQAVVDHGNQAVVVTLYIDSGKLMHFGKSHYRLANGIHKKFVEKRLAWKEGEVYSNTKVIQAVEMLNNTKMFSYVKINRQSTPPGDGKVAMTIEAAPKHSRPLEWMIEHNGLLKFNGSVGWRGVDVVDEGDILNVEARVGQHKTGLFVHHEMPDIAWPESSLITKGELYNAKWPGYKKFTAEISSTFHTPLVDKLEAYVGLSASMNEVTPRTGKASHTPILLVMPMGIRYTDFDDVTFPRQGWDAQLEITPTMKIAPTAPYVQATLRQSLLVPVTADKRIVWSAWYLVGMTPGMGRDVLPADKQFYVGGQRSVRGYGDQMAGPLATNGKPLGGKSMLAFGTAMTYYASDALMFHGFFDAGTALSRNYPTLGHQLFMSFGGGLKYKSDIGDVYLDIAFPVNRRPEDQKSQIYFGIGQPF